MTRKKSQYSRAWRKKVGEGVSRYYRQLLEEGHALPENKRCPQCDTVKSRERFGVVKRKLKSGLTSETLASWCNECKARKQRERLERLRAEGIDVKARKAASDRRWRASMTTKKREAWRERMREAQAIQRRKKGDRVLGWRKGTQPLTEGERLEPKPIIDLLVTELNLDGEAVNQFTAKGLGALAERSGVPPRRIYGLLHGEYDQVALSTVDRLLIGMDLPHMLPILYPEA